MSEQWSALSGGSDLLRALRSLFSRAMMPQTSHEKTITMKREHDATAQGLVAHWRNASERGLMRTVTARMIAGACRGVLGAQGAGWESLDVETLDVEQALARFRRPASPTSRVGPSRFTRAGFAMLSPPSETISALQRSGDITLNACLPGAGFQKKDLQQRPGGAVALLKRPDLASRGSRTAASRPIAFRSDPMSWCALIFRETRQRKKSAGSPTGCDL